MRWSARECRLRECSRFSRTAVRLLVGLLSIVPVVAPADDARQEDIAYRQKRADWMRSERSPLALAGLFWLKEGESAFGTATGNDIVLPPGSAPAKAGHIRVHGNQVAITIENGATMRLAGAAISSRQLKTDAGGDAPDLLELNNLRMKVIHAVTNWLCASLTSKIRRFCDSGVSTSTRSIPLTAWKPSLLHIGHLRRFPWRSSQGKSRS